MAWTLPGHPDPDSAGAGADTRGRARGVGSAAGSVTAPGQTPWLQGWCTTSGKVLIRSGPQGAPVPSEGRS